MVLAKDAKDAKKRLQCPKPLGELGALGEKTDRTGSWDLKFPVCLLNPLF